MFWEINHLHECNFKIIDADNSEVLNCKDFFDKVNLFSSKFKTQSKKVFFLFADNSVDTLVSYLGILKSKHCVFLLDKKLDQELRANLIDKYKPDFTIGDDISNQKDYSKIDIAGINSISHSSKNQSHISQVNKNLAVLLSTSGTTGSPKFVKLSYRNLISNAKSIATYLNIGSNEKPITSLPFSYSYGLSVINSHLLKGASLVLTNKSLLMRDFWDIFNKFNCTSFAGVPYHYQILHRLKFHRMEIPTLKTMTQAGGRLSEDYIKYFYDISIQKNLKFFVMYGQTEATARISYVPFEKLGNKIGSIGVPIPNGKMYLINTDERGVGEMVYDGPNVMMGYAKNRNDLVIGDIQKKQLKTGDIAYKDDDGYFYIVGRLKRFIKVFGLRINLDSVEKLIENKTQIPIACIGKDDLLVIICESNNNKYIDLIKEIVTSKYKLHHTVVKVFFVEHIPTTDSGKKKYKELEKMVKLYE